MKTYLLIAICVIFASCSKMDDNVVSGNVAPPDTTIENVVYEDYINRTYILILGREPDSIEFASALSVIKPPKLSLPSRYQFLDTVFNKPEYSSNVYNKLRVELLNNLDTTEITFYITLFNLYLLDPTYQSSWPVMQYELGRLTPLKSAPNEFANHLISYRELQSRMVNNYFYDQINMGSANFVITTFQHFLNRNPNITEQNSGISMVEGNNAVLFLRGGASKDDYLNIFFNSNDYYEGVAVRLYSDYLFHAPSSVQMTAAAQKYKVSGDYVIAQKDILASDEFVGIH
jgi:hypothetical protein